MYPTNFGKTGFSPRRQRGVATLIVALCVLVILTIIILSSSNVALFEQKTANNENREMLATQGAEYGLNVAGEYLKANVVNIGSNEDDDGWLTATGPNLHWVTCAGVTDTAHPCFAERNPDVRSQLYYYTTDGTAQTNSTSVKLNLPDITGAAKPTAMGGASAFPVTVRVRALLCRLDTTPSQTPTCQTSPSNGNRVAITLVADSTMAGENAAAQVKESWGTFTSFSATAAIPLVAAGVVKGLGNASIVAAPNAGGPGLAGSIWSPNSVDVAGSGGGLGSVSTCHLGDYLGAVPVSELETTCAGTGKTGCGCSNVSGGSPDMLSGHYGGSYSQEALDVLDVDGCMAGNCTTDDIHKGALPDIQFFPGQNTDGGNGDAAVANKCMDDSADATDDNLFEWIFGQDVNGKSTCDTASPNATEVANEDKVLDDLGATSIADCSSLNASSSGLYYVTGTCSLKVDVGTPDAPVVLVTKGDAKIGGNFNFFGLLMVRDAGAGASLKGVGNVNVFGAVVVDGDVDLAGGFNIVYVESSAGKPGSKNTPTTRFARLPGSWLDSTNGF